MIIIKSYLAGFEAAFPDAAGLSPWDFIGRLPEILLKMISHLGNDYVIRNDVAVHRSADIEATAVIRGPAIISEGALVGGYALIRNGAFVGSNSIIGAHSEFKNSVIMHGSACGHLNFVGESMIGSNVNLEAGAVLANHYNELKDKNVMVQYANEIIDTGRIKFGLVIGDGSRIGANAVVCAGVLLPKNSIINRLELVEVSSR